MSPTRPAVFLLFLKGAVKASGGLPIWAATPLDLVPPSSEVGNAGFLLIGGVIGALVALVSGLVFIPVFVGYATHAGVMRARPAAAVQAGPMLFWACAATWGMALLLFGCFRLVPAGWALCLLEMATPVAGAAWSYCRQRQRLRKA